MRIALFSDIHGNISRLKAVLHAIDKDGGADMLIAAGDLLGGGPGTDDLLDLLHERQVRLVRGNAEEVWLDLDAAWERMFRLWQKMEPDRDFALERANWMDDLRPTVDWMRSNLSEPYWKLLAELPVSLVVDVAPEHRLMVCHATPDSTWPPVTGIDTPLSRLQEIYGQVDADVIAFGHIHRHHVRQLDSRLLVNVSSVKNRADVPGHSAFTWLKFENNNWLVEQLLIPYDTLEEERLKAERKVPPL